MKCPAHLHRKGSRSIAYLNNEKVPQNAQYGKIQDTSIKPENIKFTVPSNKKKLFNFSYKDIKLTAHARDRAYSRLGITSATELQKLAAMAKKNGLKLNTVEETNYTDFGLTEKEYLWLMDKGNCKSNEVVYFYNGWLYIFIGKKYRLLKTVIYPGVLINGDLENQDTDEEDIVDKFFNSIIDNPFHNNPLDKKRRR